MVRCLSILQKYEGGQARFVEDVPNRSLRADGELAAVTFMTPSDAKGYVSRLEERGLKYADGGEAADVVVVDQHTGMRARCVWAAFGTTNWNDVEGQSISVCQSVPSSVGKVVVPQGWKYEGSLTTRGVYVPADAVPGNLKFLRREPGRDVFWDESEKREMYVSRLG